MFRTLRAHVNPRAIHKVVLVLAVPLTGCCVYLGQLSPGGRAIEYTHATANSAMAGMTLHRVNSQLITRHDNGAFCVRKGCVNRRSDECRN